MSIRAQHEQTVSQCEENAAREAENLMISMALLYVKDILEMLRGRTFIETLLLLKI